MSSSGRQTGRQTGEGIELQTMSSQPALAQAPDEYQWVMPMVPEPPRPEQHGVKYGGEHFDYQRDAGCMILLVDWFNSKGCCMCLASDEPYRAPAEAPAPAPQVPPPQLASAQIPMMVTAATTARIQEENARRVVSAPTTVGHAVGAGTSSAAQTATATQTAVAGPSGSGTAAENITVPNVSSASAAHPSSAGAAHIGVAQIGVAISPESGSVTTIETGSTPSAQN
ncbi:hypothetical protein F5Y16DRAFT_401298 [Xylariaceae sp. FL0255]|nr:hypothetical protein F5Y16DRAFT_401298 [Xylariaceae sp. FL0255]